MKERIKSVLKPMLAMSFALALCWVILILAGYEAATSFKALWNAGFRNLRSFGDVLNKSCPLLFTGIAVAFAFRGSVFNIGAEGQFLMGASAATCTGIILAGLPSWMLIPLIILSGALTGAAWGYIPGYLKARHQVSEVITTIMFNYVALQFVGILVRGPIKDISQAEPQSYKIAEAGMLPYILPGTRVHLGFVLGIIVAICIYILLSRTVYGYNVRSVGLNATAAKTGGISTERTMISTMLISGAIAGMGGAIEISGVTHYLLEGISPGYGFTAIAVSILAANHPLGVILTSFLFGFLSAGATSMQRATEVSASFVGIFQGIIVISVAIAAVKRSRIIRFVAKKGEK